MSYICSWSGGKDGALGYYREVRNGRDVKWLMNSISDDFNRVRFHGTEAKLIQLQAESMGVELVQHITSADEYERDFKRAIEPLITEGAEGMLFGDIYVPENRQWCEEVCNGLGIEAIFPLWDEEPKELFLELMESGFEAVVVGANSRIVDKKWVGQPLSAEFLEYLINNGVDPCGENGEFHTFLVDAPMFEKRIKITQSKTVKINGYWFLDTQAY